MCVRSHSLEPGFGDYQCDSDVIKSLIQSENLGGPDAHDTGTNRWIFHMQL